MRFIRSLAAVLLLCSSQSMVVFAADLEDEVVAAYEGWNAAFNKGDAKAIAAAYVDDATLLPPTHTVLSGPEEIEEFFAGLLEAGVTDHTLDVIEVGGDGNLVYSAANWTAKGKDEQGNPQDVGGIATHVFERQDSGELKLKLHTFN
jgi:uncharacterized protein (TIGR02246 family)